MAEWQSTKNDPRHGPIKVALASRERWPDRADLILIGCFAVLAAAIQCSRLGAAPLWLDEGNSYAMSSLSWREIWFEVPMYEVHPQLYHLLLKAWRIFGESEFALRSLSVVAAVLTVPLVYAMARTVAGTAARFGPGFAAALFALSPLHLDYALQVRPYTWLTLCVALSLWGAAWLFTHPDAANRPWFGIGRRGRATTAAPGGLSALPAWIATILGSAGALWFHNTAFTFVGALALVTLFISAARKFPLYFLINAVMAGLMILAIWSPFLAIFFIQLDAVSQAYWTSALTWDQAVSPLTKVVALGLEYPVTFAPAIVPLYYLGARSLVRSGRGSAAALLLGVVAIAYVLCLAFSFFVQSILIDRVFAWMNVPLLVCVACGTAAIDQKWLRNAVVLVLLAVSCVGSWQRLHWPGTEPWDKIAATILDEPGPDKVVLLVPSTLGMTLSYYLRPLGEDITVKSIPEEFPSFNTTRPYAAGTTTLRVLERDVPLIRDYVSSGRVLWIIRRMNHLNDPDDIVLRVARGLREEVDTWIISPTLSVHRFE